MRHNNFAVFILTHGRPTNVRTYKTLLRCGYTGPIYFIVDDEDKTIDQYKQAFGEERIKVFNKKKYADQIDEGNNFDDRRTITHARNASFDIARDLHLDHFIQLDDDYYYFGYRYDTGAKIIKNLNGVFDALIDFYDSTNIKSIAFSQGGDHIGGFLGIKLKRKCMNSFLCSPERQFQFVGSMNEDVNTYTTLGSRGDLFFTFTNLQLDQKDTQSQASGITDMYKRFGTYAKAFTTLMMHPSGVKISLMNSTNPRIHHSIDWNATAPMIISAKHKKNAPKSMLPHILETFYDEPILKADGFDEAIIGINEADLRLIYSVSKCVQILSRDMPEEDAIDYFYANVCTAYVGEQTPIWCYDDFEMTSARNF